LQHNAGRGDINPVHAGANSPVTQGRNAMETDRYGYASSSVALITLLLLLIQLQFDSPSPLWG
jgi:hypothetical protein